MKVQLWLFEESKQMSYRNILRTFHVWPVSVECSFHINNSPPENK
jgi:hypothetical protein